MKMIEFRKLLLSFLKGIHPRVYFQQAPTNAVFPYLVYEFSNVLDDGEGLQIINLDVDGWDNEDDSTPLELLMENLNNNLNKMTLTIDSLVVTFYLDRILYLKDEGYPSLNRTKYMYQARLMKRE
jgi:hypothetical protein